MMITSRPYQTESDLYSIQAATSAWIASAGFRGYLNPSDIALRLFNGMRRYDPAEIVRLWQNPDGQVIAWGMVCPPWNCYEALLHPDYQQGDLAVRLLNWAERKILNWLRKERREHEAVHLALFDGDTARVALLESRGYSRSQSGGLISTRPLTDEIPQPHLPDGFSIRHLHGEQEIDQLVTLLNDSFGWAWTAENYLKVLHSPGCIIDNELVVVAPDGRFAAACHLLPDAHNHSSMFENVGTGSSFRRSGLAKALLYEGTRRMKTAGFTLAMVPHNAGPAADALYYSVGFQPTYSISQYTIETHQLAQRHPS